MIDLSNKNALTALPGSPQRNDAQRKPHITLLAGIRAGRQTPPAFPVRVQGTSGVMGDAENAFVCCTVAGAALFSLSGFQTSRLTAGVNTPAGTNGAQYIKDELTQTQTIENH